MTLFGPIGSDVRQFAFGLMNGLAMGVFAVMMFMEATLFSRAKWAKIWDVLPLR